MGTREATRAYRMQRWVEIISQCRNSGETVKAWCESQGVNIKTYYYWQRKVRETASATLPACRESTEEASTELRPTFAEIALPSPQPGTQAAVIVRYREAIIEVRSGAEAFTIESALRAVKNVC
ncbi:MAG: IS66 family insertion sequence element accessory protein TnpB [Ethanoligenens sp.]